MHSTDQKLWYAELATKFTEALPVGNGCLGAMVFGGCPTERICFNENTLWGGDPAPVDRPEAELPWTSDSFQRGHGCLDGALVFYLNPMF